MLTSTRPNYLTEPDPGGVYFESHARLLLQTRFFVTSLSLVSCPQGCGIEDDAAAFVAVAVVFSWSCPNEPSRNKQNHEYDEYDQLLPVVRHHGRHGKIPHLP